MKLPMLVKFTSQRSMWLYNTLPQTYGGESNPEHPYLILTITKYKGKLCVQFLTPSGDVRYLYTSHSINSFMAFSIIEVNLCHT
jgi:hypothetical protein